MRSTFWSTTVEFSFKSTRVGYYPLIHCSRLFSLLLSTLFKLSTYTCTGAIDFPRTFFPSRVILGGLQQHWQREMETLGGIKSGWPLSREKKWKGKLKVVLTGQKGYISAEKRGDGKTRKDKRELSQRAQQKNTVGWRENTFPAEDSESN